MEHRSYFLQITVFFALCLALCAGVWYGLQTLEDYREEYDMIVNERDNFETIMDGLRAKNKTLQSISKVTLANVNTSADSVAFYSEVQRLIQENSLNMLSMQYDKNILSLQLQGNYYSLVHLFADWREMPFASRVNALKITRDAQSPADLVDAELTLEAWIE
ncbi:MAG: hypothetical protein IJS40_04075 [Synergistaceae bacterium]|nr:hypothetical protein [Synergistaceae bacterium]